MVKLLGPLVRIKNKIVGRIKAYFQKGVYLVQITEKDKEIEALLEKLREVQAENAKLQAKLREYEKQKEQEKEEKKIIKDVLRWERERKRYETPERVYLIPFAEEDGKLKPVKLKVRFLNHTKLIDADAIVMEDTEDGYTTFTWGSKLGKKIVPLKRWLPDFYSLFLHQINLTKQMIGGIIDTPFDLTKDGKLVVKLFKVASNPSNNPGPKEKGKKKKQQEKEVEVVPMSEQERKYYEDVIANLQDRIGQLKHMLEKKQEENIKLRTKLADLELSESAARQLARENSARLVQLAKEMTELTRLVSSVLAVYDEATIDSILHQKEKIPLIRKIDELRRLVDKYETKGVEAVAEDRAFDRIERGIDLSLKVGKVTTEQLRDTIDSLRGLPRSPKKEEKGE